VLVALGFRGTAAGWWASALACWPACFDCPAGEVLLGRMVLRVKALPDSVGAGDGDAPWRRSPS
jgi:hypothetical protein